MERLFTQSGFEIDIEFAQKYFGQSVDIERYSDKEKPKRCRRRDNLESLLIISSFLIELQDVLLGKRGAKQRAPKKARMIVGKGLDKVGQNKDASEKPKKEEEDADYSDDGDHNQNEYFDDDEDDYNDVTGGDDEPEL